MNFYFKLCIKYCPYEQDMKREIAQKVDATTKVGILTNQNLVLKANEDKVMFEKELLMREKFNEQLVLVNLKAIQVSVMSLVMTSCLSTILDIYTF